MSDWPKYLALGFIQGVTEFLPVSSSWHLVVARELLGLHTHELFLEVCLHFGSLLAILAVFYRDIWKLIADGARGTLMLLQGAGRAAIGERAPMFTMALAIVIGSVPIGIAGVGFHDEIKSAFESLRWSSAFLVVTGLLLIASRFAPKARASEVSPRKGLVVGLAQACALLPGISRSGSTIVTGYFLGFDRELAARFSFLLALSALAGATVLEVARTKFHQAPAMAQGDIMSIIAGTLVSAVVGWICLVLLFRVIRKGNLHWFAAYCIPAGLLLFLLSFAK